MTSHPDACVLWRPTSVRARRRDPAQGDEITLSISGNLKEEYGGTAIEGQDCVTVVGPETEMPEFTTIAVPVAITLGFLLFFSYRRRRKEAY